LLESQVKLPFLSVELPLVAFFFLAPILFIVSQSRKLVVEETRSRGHRIR
jgi:hypothetical protein